MPIGRQRSDPTFDGAGDISRTCGYVEAFRAPTRVRPKQRRAVEAALRQWKAEVVIDELTSLPKAQSDMPKYATGDRKLRIKGGGNLFARRRRVVCGGIYTNRADSS